jgi:aminopeptidase N
MKYSLGLLLSVLWVLSSCTFNEVEVVEGVSSELAEYRKASISNIRYELRFVIPKQIETPISATESITFRLSNTFQDLQLDFREDPGLIQELTVNGQNAYYSFAREHLIISRDYLKEGENRIDIRFTAGESSLNRNPDYLYTLFVPDRARTAFPLFDQPNLKARYELTLVIPKEWKAISNAPIITDIEDDYTREIQFAESDLISSYLFSFVAGDFEKVSRIVDGRAMTMLHRETDPDKVNRNLDDIFKLHAASLDWLENYTGIPYPFQKFDFALIPSFQYGGMEHVGAIQYNASSLFLDENPSQSRLLSRASLIAHETAHMWFGDLVTMNWFNDVWTKEVFANFMAAKIVNPGFPEINHDLNFLLRHYPAAYSVDRTEGANPIRQELPNLNEAGSLYGAIIYNKAPIMMRQLELLLGEATFQKGMQQYLSTYAHSNATWPDLIEILDALTEENLNSWSDVWVNSPGRPHIEIKDGKIIQSDPWGLNRVWPQVFEVTYFGDETHTQRVELKGKDAALDIPEGSQVLLNSDGYGYGLFQVDAGLLKSWENLNEVQKGSLLISVFENVLEGKGLNPQQYIAEHESILGTEENQLLLGRAMGQLAELRSTFLDDESRIQTELELEQVYLNEMQRRDDSSIKKMYFDAYQEVVQSEEGLKWLEQVWNKEQKIEGINFSESDFISMAGTLAIRNPNRAQYFINTQLDRIKNEDRRRRFEFIAPSLSGVELIRDEFFDSLKDEENRQTESWVLAGLRALHHPSRRNESEKYILPSLILLEEIQQTGDIFFPKRWLDATLGNYNSATAVKTVEDFLAERPDYNAQLRMKILQSADQMKRAHKILSKSN